MNMRWNFVIKGASNVWELWGSMLWGLIRKAHIITDMPECDATHLPFNMIPDSVAHPVDSIENMIKRKTLKSWAIQYL